MYVKVMYGTSACASYTRVHAHTRNTHTRARWNRGSQSVDVAKFLLNLVGGDHFSRLYHFLATFKFSTFIYILTLFFRSTFTYSFHTRITLHLLSFTRTLSVYLCDCIFHTRGDIFVTFVISNFCRTLIFNSIKFVLIKLHCHRRNSRGVY